MYQFAALAYELKNIPILGLIFLFWDLVIMSIGIDMLNSLIITGYSDSNPKYKAVNIFRSIVKVYKTF